MICDSTALLRPMPNLGSVSRWIAALKLGDRSAALPLWKRYYRRMVALARKMLSSARPKAADEEDVVQNAFHSFFRALGHGRFPKLEDRDSLWRLLMVITANKALKQLKHERRQKRGGGKARADMMNAVVADSSEESLGLIVGAEPTPDFAAQVADDYQRLLNRLGDETLRQVAIWKMEGYGNREIADKLACSRRTVARKMDAIRSLWIKTSDS
jgi:RNA polymerase sigma factor (sigma-70 family)